MFIVQCKKLRKADVTKNVTAASSKAASANDFLNQGMNCVTVAHGYMGDEFATTLAPSVASGQPTVEDTITSVVDDLLVGEYNDPVRVIGFNTTERNLRDVSEEVAREIRQRCADEGRELPEFLEQFFGHLEQPT